MKTEMQKILSNCSAFLNNKKESVNTFDKASHSKHIKQVDLDRLSSSISAVTAFDLAEVLGIALCNQNMIESIVNHDETSYHKISDAVYNMAINNCSRQISLDAALKERIRKMRSEKRVKQITAFVANHDAFRYSQILAIGFLKNSEDIILDIIANDKFSEIDTDTYL